MIKDFESQQLSDQGFPYCPDCGSTLFWNADFMASELGYLDEDVPFDEDVVINSLMCSNEECAKTFEVMSENGEYHLLCVASEPEADDDEPNYEYTEYAIKRFPILKELLGNELPTVQ